MRNCLAAVVGIVSSLGTASALAGFTTVAVTKDSKAAKELGFTLTLSENALPSELQGTTTFDFQAPKTGKLKSFSRAILRIATGDRATARVPLEIDASRPGEIRFHFQLTPELTRHAYLDLICPVKGMPNGTIYQIELSTFLD